MGTDARHPFSNFCKTRAGNERGLGEIHAVGDEVRESSAELAQYTLRVESRVATLTTGGGRSCRHLLFIATPEDQTLEPIDSQRLFGQFPYTRKRQQSPEDVPQ